MNRISPGKQSQRFSLRSLFVVVSVAAIFCALVSNWESIVCRIKYGDPVDLSSVDLVGINDDAYMLEIDGQRVHTLDSRTVALMKWHASTGDTNDPIDITINGVWRSRTDHTAFTVKIGDEFVATR